MKKFLCALAVTAVVTGCGGSREESHDPSHGETTPPPPIPMVTADAVYYSPKCSIERPAQDVRFVVHDVDGSIIREQKTNAQGHIELNWNNGETHLTIVRNRINDEGNTDQSLISQVSLKAGDLGKVFISDDTMDQQCECQDVHIDFSEITQTFDDDYDIYVNNSSTSGYNDDIKESCLINGEYEPISVTVIHQYDDTSPAFAARLMPTESNVQETFRVSMDQLSQSSHVNILLNNDGNDVWTSANTEFGSEAWVDHRGQNAFVFDELHDDNYIYNSYYQTIHDLAELSFRHRGYKLSKVNDLSKTYDLGLPNNSVQILSETKLLLENLSNESSAKYDFSGLEPKYHRIFVSFLGVDLPSWYLIAPISGEIPWFRLPTDIESKMTNGEFYQFDISLTGYNFDGDYDDLRKEMATYSRKQGYKWENYFETLINEKIYTTVN